MIVEAIAKKLLTERQTSMDRVINRLLGEGARQDDIEIQYHPNCVRIMCWNEKVAEYSFETCDSAIILHGHERTSGIDIYSVCGPKILTKKR